MDAQELRPGSADAAHGWRGHRGPASEPPGRGPQWRRGARRRSWWLVPSLGVPMLVGCLVAAERQPDAAPLDWLGTGLLVLAALALAARFRAPVATLAVTTVATAAYVGLDYPSGPSWLAFGAAVLGAVVRGRRGAAWAMVLAGTLGAVLLWRVNQGAWPSTGAVASRGAWLLALLGGAEFFRGRAERFAEVRRIATETGRRRASEERLLMAQELHDVLAHSVSLINVQASTALHLFDEDPERARSALAAIKGESRETLEELRATVRALRAEGDAPRAPAAGLDDLDALVAQTTAVGPRASVERRGEPREVPPRVGLAAYRIVQEALTNTRRHASAASAVHVLLDYGPHALEVTVHDDGAEPPESAEAPLDGHGLRGMRERAEALGGSLVAGSGAGGGWTVAARLPLPAHTGTPPGPATGADR